MNRSDDFPARQRIPHSASLAREATARHEWDHMSPKNRQSLILGIRARLLGKNSVPGEWIRPNFLNEVIAHNFSELDQNTRGALTSHLEWKGDGYIFPSAIFRENRLKVVGE